MKKREKIIVAVMVAALLYGCYHFLFSDSSGSNKNVFNNIQAPVNEFVTDLIMRIRQSDSTERDNLILKKSSGVWKKDPFLVLQKITNVEEENKKKEKIILSKNLAGAFNYSGYIEMGKSRLGIINGREYLAGDNLAIKGAVLQKVSPKEVHILLEEGQGVIVIPIEDTGQ
jgi:hypothetical protein